MADEPDEDPDRAAILARRQRFIALALSGLAGTAACDKPTAPTTAPTSDDGKANDDGTPSDDGTPPPDTGPAPQVCLMVVAPQPCLSPPETPPQPCLDVAVPQPCLSPPAPPQVCLKVARPEPPPTRPSPCLDVGPPQPPVVEPPEARPRPCLHIKRPPPRVCLNMMLDHDDDDEEPA